MKLLHHTFIFFLVCLTSFLTCCSDEITPDDLFVTYGVEFELKLQGKATVLPDSLVLDMVDLQDSRCPSDPGVQCFWEGQVYSKVVLTSALGKIDTAEVILRVNHDQLRADSTETHRIEIMHVIPEEKRLNGPPLSDYTISFRVDKL